MSISGTFQLVSNWQFVLFVDRDGPEQAQIETRLLKTGAVTRTHRLEPAWMGPADGPAQTGTNRINYTLALHKPAQTG